MLPIVQTIRGCGTKSLELRARVQEYYHKLIDETQDNPKAMWKTINKVLH